MKTNPVGQKAPDGRRFGGRSSRRGGSLGRARRIVRARSNAGEDSEGRDRARRAHLCEEVEGPGASARARNRREGAVMAHPARRSRSSLARLREAERTAATRPSARGAARDPARREGTAPAGKAADVTWTACIVSGGVRAARVRSGRRKSNPTWCVRGFFAFRGAHQKSPAVFLIEESPPCVESRVKASSGPAARSTSRTRRRLPVSYTHLTLPTICSV